MEINWSILGWIAGLLFVYIFGLFEGRNKGYKKRKAEEVQEKKDQPAPNPATITADNPGLLRIKTENGLLTLDLDGARVDTSALTPNHRKRLIEIVTLIRPWLEGRPVTAPTATPSLTTPPPTQPAPAPIINAQSPSQPVPAQPADKAPNKSAPAAKKDEKPAPATTMVGQINEILQLRIANTNLAAKGVVMIESPSGGVYVYVGMDKYEGVDAVPDEEIKAAIRSAIAEWEKKYTPGL